MFSPEWEAAFNGGTHHSVLPWSELVSYVSRYAKPREEFCRVLELGCGVGANIPFFMAFGSEYCSIEGSASAVSVVRATYPHLAAEVVVGDFTTGIPFEGPFDLVVDRAATTHNSTDGVEATLRLVHDRLRSGGKLIGVDWFSSAHQDARGGTEVDAHSRRDISSGHLSGLGVVHFFDRPHLEDLLSRAGFDLDRLEHKVFETVHPTTYRIAA